MRSLKVLLNLFLFVTALIASQAQDDGGYASTVRWYYSACEDRMVVDLQGKMQAGYDLYYQAFDRFGGLGDPLTELTRVDVDGDYAVSQAVHWLNDATRALGTPISVVFRIAQESDPDSTLFQEPSDDFLGECHEPGETLIVTDEMSVPEDMISSANVFRPDGAYLNPVYRRPLEHLVHIGARPSETDNRDRTANPGVIFAGCLDAQGADPGLIYDTDELKIFWSWFATTRDQVQDHINSAQYVVKIDTQPIPSVQTSEIKRMPGDPNYWVFYTVSLGDKWRPGGYVISFVVTWSNPITDGYDDFGPGTVNERLESGCRYAIRKNPYGLDIMPERPKYPLDTFPWTGLEE